MKRFLLLFVLLLAVMSSVWPLYCSQLPLLRAGKGGSAAPVVAGLVQSTTISNIRTNAMGTTVNSCPTKAFCFFLPNATQAGNAIIGCASWSTSPSATITVTDDQSNTYSFADTATDSSNGQKVGLFVALNVAANTRAIKITSDVASTQVGVMASEFYNIATSSAVDVHNTGNSASGSSTMATSSITPSQTGEILFQCGRRTQTKAGTFTAGSQSNITWKLLTTDNIDGMVSQYGTYSSTSSISPQLTMGSNSGYATVSAGFKTATAGSARPSGMQIISIAHLNYVPGDLNLASIAIQFPSAGNLLVASSGFGGATAACVPSSITDTGSNTWSHVGSLGDGVAGRSDIFYANNTTTSNGLTLTVNITSGDAVCDATLLIYDIVGAATSSFVQATGVVDGNEADASSYTFYAAPVAPGADSGISIWNHIQATSTTQTSSSPCTTVDIATFGGETIDGGTDHAPDENQGWGHCAFAASTEQTYTIGFANTDLNSAAYHVAFFKSATANNTFLASDPFTRSNRSLTAAPQDALYIAENGKTSFDIVSNGVQPNSFAVDGGTIYKGTTFPNDQWATCTLGTVTGSGSFSGVGLLLRAASGAHTEYRILVNANNGTNTYIDAFNANSNRTLSSANSGAVWTSGDVLYAEIKTVSGDQVIKVRKGSGGSDIISKTDNVGANEITSGQPGVTYSSTITAGSCASFQAGTF